jgi:hypothetical protein
LKNQIGNEENYYDELPDFFDKEELEEEENR